MYSKENFEEYKKHKAIADEHEKLLKERAKCILNDILKISDHAYIIEKVEFISEKLVEIEYQTHYDTEWHHIPVEYLWLPDDEIRAIIAEQRAKELAESEAYAAKRADLEKEARRQQYEELKKEFGV